MEVNPSNRAKLGPKIKQHREKIDTADKNLRRAMNALSNSAAAREELFAYEGTNEDQVREHTFIYTYIGLVKLDAHRCQKQSLLSNTDRLDRATNRLDDGLKYVHIDVMYICISFQISHPQFMPAACYLFLSSILTSRIVHETVNVGVNIMQELNEQRQQIERSRKRVGLAIGLLLTRTVGRRNQYGSGQGEPHIDVNVHTVSCGITFASLLASSRSYVTRLSFALLRYRAKQNKFVSFGIIILAIGIIALIVVLIVTR